ncbi:uncharacterized protein FOMMEDRAFT_144054 [Fomitiporia mediterranea MF3/22]|uniref:uncharacterized protein n=1 Tax=Fomitiporia mediterranea (strain MF3/22) TaxID=694068 RepID=UPI0004409949|nr:uncharacterized protein FOMMEDRAFT_144054 [Fomitiporia mediterranea MF3/22]EJD07804.1 hypothetical protein FOMMEDRAFT_144054 [Fomitiporia mediterranea MF3/22]
MASQVVSPPTSTRQDNLLTQIATDTTSQSSPASANLSPAQPADSRHISLNPNSSPPMKDRTVSASTDKSGRIASGQPQMLTSVSTGHHRVGSRSPTSIPSSPTSVHSSSSSAIFERDVTPSHPIHTHPTNPHRTPRSKTTEPIEASVPSVLDSAAALLTSTDEHEEQFIAVEAPVTSASNITSGVGSPVGRGSRSPSPSMSAGAGRGVRTSMLLNLPSPIQSSIVSVPLSPSSVSSTGAGRAGGSPPHAGSQSGSPKVSPPSLTTNFSAEPPVPGGFSPSQIVYVETARQGNGTSTPTSTGGSTHYESAPSSPKTTTLEHPPNSLPVSPTTPTAPTTFSSSPSGGSSFPQARVRPHPPSPSQNAHKRLSFLSYNDILASTPVSTVPLSNLTSPPSDAPPPHIPSVSLSVGAVDSGSPFGSAYGEGASRTASLVNSARNSLVLDGIFGPGHSHSGPAVDVKEPTGGVGDEPGGEWEREGFGRSLAERLEEASVAVAPGKA